MTFCYIISLTFIASKAFPNHLKKCSQDLHIQLHNQNLMPSICFEDNDNILFQYYIDSDNNICPCGNETNRSLGRLCCLCNTVVVIFHVSVN